MSKSSLLLTLGHNSSAIFVYDDEIQCGFETERLSCKKSDSSFPYTPILEIEKYFEIPKDVNIYVSHWFTDGTCVEKNKYWDPDFLSLRYPDSTVYAVNQEFSHHDSHAYSAHAFAGDSMPKDGTLIFVADGFGTHGETVSIYEYLEDTPNLIFRSFGFDKSIGLFYQYSTAFQGMKMNNHEYKMLGYEAHIGEVSNIVDINVLNKLADVKAKKFYANILSGNAVRELDPIVSKSALQALQHAIGEELDNVRLKCGIGKSDMRTLRIAISYYTQRVTEDAIMYLINTYSPENVILVGGVFMNVKVNSKIADAIPGKTCVMPLSGDQGAAIGVYAFSNPDFKWPDNLTWGWRVLNNTLLNDVERLYATSSVERFIELVIEKLYDVGYVNIVRDSMEFGARALCNTTTLAIPTPSIVSKINSINGRTSVMPMAPVVSKKGLKRYFKDTDKIHKSLEYMCITRDYADNINMSQVRGAAHVYKTNDGYRYTGRPQVTDDPIMLRILNEFDDILINTSFNTHGHPIIFDANQVVGNHIEQLKNDPYREVSTIVLVEDTPE